jgi:hypothetical protein
MGEAQPGRLAGCFGGTLPAPVAAGDQWTLRASVPGYGTIHGTTTVPDLPALADPAEGSRFTYASRASPPGREAEIPVTWAAPGARRLTFVLGQGTAIHGGEPVHGAVCHPAVEWRPAVLDRPSGTITLRVFDVWCSAGNQTVQWDSARFVLSVTSYDSAYAAYALHGSSTTRGRGGRGVEGAYGVFGSAATATRTIVLVPQP